MSTPSSASSKHTAPLPDDKKEDHARHPDADPNRKPGVCPFSGAALSGVKWSPHKHVPVAVRSGKQVPTTGSKSLLQSIGGVQKLRAMCTRFYAKAFEDKVLAEFMFEDDGATAHGLRLGNWIAEKMSGDSSLWTKTRPPDSRSTSHHKAWYSKKRPAERQGRRFKLDDCRNWMRLMFWAAREEGLHEHKAFWSWYVSFIGHFIAVYERSAPPYAAESAEWSADVKNIETYIANGRHMKEIVGVGVHNSWF